jgi:hypothetical protein
MRDAVLGNYKKLGKDPIYLSEPVEELCSSNGIRQADYLDSSLTNSDIYEWKHNRNYRLAHYMMDKMKHALGHAEEKFNGGENDEEMNLLLPIFIIMACLLTFRYTSRNGETE